MEKRKSKRLNKRLRELSSIISIRNHINSKSTKILNFLNIKENDLLDEISDLIPDLADENITGKEPNTRHQINNSKTNNPTQNDIPKFEEEKDTHSNQSSGDFDFLIANPFANNKPRTLQKSEFLEYMESNGDRIEDKGIVIYRRADCLFYSAGAKERKFHRSIISKEREIFKCSCRSSHVRLSYLKKQDGRRKLKISVKSLECKQR